MRLCREWLWRASLQNSAGALTTLDTKSVLKNELLANIQMLDQQDAYRGLQPGQSFGLGGPNLGCLLCALFAGPAVQSTPKLSLAAFAATTPTLRVGSTPSQGTTGPVTLIAVNEMKQILL